MRSRHLVAVAVAVAGAVPIIGGFARAASGSGAPVTISMTVVQSQQPNRAEPTARTLVMQTNLNLEDPMVTARTFPANGYGPTTVVRIIGPNTYIAGGSQTGDISAPLRAFEEDATYVVPEYLGRSDFDPSVLWSLLKAVSIGPPRPVSSSTGHGGRTATYRLTLSTSRFLELQGADTYNYGPANPVELLVDAAENGGIFWSLVNPFTTTSDIPVTVTIVNGGVPKLNFFGSVPSHGRQLFTESFSESADPLVVTVPRLAVGPTSTACLATSTTRARPLNPKTAYSPTLGSAFAVVSTSDGRFSFVSGLRTVDVYSDSSFAPRLLWALSLKVPGSPAGSAAEPLGESLTPDGKYLLVATGSGALVFSVPALEQESPDAQVGALLAPSGTGAIEVAVTPDGQFAFVTLEDSAEMAVFNLASALGSNFASSGFVGAVPLGGGPVGIAIAPGGETMYVTSELASASPGTSGDSGSGAGASAAAATTSDGTLSVINVSTAESDPAQAVLASVDAGCSPVRVVVSPDGSSVWVTARGDNQVLAFSAANIVSDRAQALLARVTVGQSPVDLAFIEGGTRLVVADSNRFYVFGATSALTLVDPAAALAGGKAVIGSVRTGLFPRELDVNTTGTTLLVTDFDSSQLEAVALARL